MGIERALFYTLYKEWLWRTGIAPSHMYSTHAPGCSLLKCGCIVICPFMPVAKRMCNMQHALALWRHPSSPFHHHLNTALKPAHVLSVTTCHYAALQAVLLLVFYVVVASAITCPFTCLCGEEVICFMMTSRACLWLAGAEAKRLLKSFGCTQIKLKPPAPNAILHPDASLSLACTGKRPALLQCIHFKQGQCLYKLCFPGNFSSVIFVGSPLLNLARWAVDSGPWS